MEHWDQTISVRPCESLMLVGLSNGRFRQSTQGSCGYNLLHLSDDPAADPRRQDQSFKSRVKL